ncbi:serine protease [Wenzhouxiangella sp. XN79A]|uniref:patatin-like phospholipase family protein n=1 Tax=Wenzhouxiangella sp. XN79A TaxID=2724193 RepID=UPI00144A6BB2|nr:patatin-like phospholipase family protein [Wenzhouxiangella sp. XN79A]NKI36302.1 serine protease [Wenzhouxiangella sp. XN79A]
MSSPKARERTLSLVLGSGGARGLAHIGAIQAIEEAGWEIKSIAGSSMGALVGGMYAAGKLDVYTEWVQKLQQSDVLRLVDWTLSGGGLIRGDKIIKRLREMVGDVDIGDLEIDFTAVAVDIEHGREIWLSDGSLFEAIRSSIAIPGLFTPHRYRGRLLVDGGILNPIPVAPTLRCLTDATFVINCNGPAGNGGASKPLGPLDEGIDPEGEASVMNRLRRFFADLTDRQDDENEDEPGLVAILIKSLETMESVITRQHLAVFRPDRVIDIPRDACMLHEFHRARELIELGRTRTIESLKTFDDRHDRSDEPNHE